METTAHNRRLKRSILSIIAILAIVGWTIYSHRRNTGVVKIVQQIETQQLPTAAKNFNIIGQYFFKAFYDTRETLGGNRKFVRIMTVLDINAYNDSFLCQFFDTTGAVTSSAVVTKSQIGFGQGHKHHYYREFIFSCQVNDQLNSAAHVVVKSYDQQYQSQVISVQHNPLSRGLSNQQKFANSVINCVSVTYGNPDEHRLLEWLEIQKLLGVSKVQLHFYHMTNEKLEKLAKWYGDDFLEIRYTDCLFCERGRENYMGLLLMSIVINQCFYEHLGGYNYTAVFDLDEMIVPQQHDNYVDLIKFLEAKHRSVSFAFPNWYHFYELGELSQLPDYLPMLRHPRRVKEQSEPGYAPKSIHMSNYVVAMHNHYCWDFVAELPNGYERSTDTLSSIGINQHFKFCHFDKETCAKMTNTSDGVLGREHSVMLWLRMLTILSLK